MIHSRGKLLISGEYLVLDGATALALPTKPGQSLSLEAITSSENTDLFGSKPVQDTEAMLEWKSFDMEDKLWFEAVFELQHLAPVYYSDFKTALQVSRLLQSCRAMNPQFLPKDKALQITTNLDFPRNWGLGSSSTLTANLAKIAKVNALDLHFGCFNGSGYDVAVGMAGTPVLYTIFEGKPIVEPVTFRPAFRNYIWFVYSGDKQNSSKEVSSYRKKNRISTTDLYRISDISNHMLKCGDLREFEEMMREHESIISKVLDRPGIKTEHFYDYPHAVKSLGAWGGDFFMATGSAEDMQYFRNKGYEIIITFEDLIA